jgi:transcriptional regulator with XRE-family HTH domain
VVSSLIKRILAACELKQAELAKVLGVSLDRIKSLASGKAQKLAANEVKILVEKLHVDPAFLATGEGPVLQDPNERRFEEKIKLIRESTNTATLLEMPDNYQQLVRDILVGTALRHGDMVKESIDLFLIDQITSRLLPEALSPTSKQAARAGPSKPGTKKSRK